MSFYQEQNTKSTRVAQIRSNIVVLYNKRVQKFSTHNNSSFFNSLGRSKPDIFKEKAYSGQLTQGSIKRLTKSINLLVASTPKKIVYNTVINKHHPFKLAFITLTIPTSDVISAKICQKELLEPFLKWLRQVHGMKSYVWKLELQERGQIHYHITSDCFVNHVELRNKWNKLLAKGEYMNEYIARENHTNANSTDIHSVKKVKNLANYLVKYLTKSSQNPTAINGKIWDCSVNLKHAKYFSIELDDDLEFYISDKLDDKSITKTYSDYFTVIKFQDKEAISIFPSSVRDLYNQNLIEIRGFKRCLFDYENLTIEVEKKDCSNAYVYQTAYPDQKFLTLD